MGPGGEPSYGEGEIWDIRAGWQKRMQDSAWAEPRAAVAALEWIQTHLKGRTSIALVSDHRSIATGQRRWFSFFGGSGASYYLNHLYEVFYDSPYEREIYYVEGPMNIADKASRSSRLRQPLRWNKADVIFPSLAHYEHPYASKPKREPYNV